MFVLAVPSRIGELLLFSLVTYLPWVKEHFSVIIFPDILKCYILDENYLTDVYYHFLLPLFSRSAVKKPLFLPQLFKNSNSLGRGWVMMIIPFSWLPVWMRRCVCVFSNINWHAPHCRLQTEGATEDGIEGVTAILFTCLYLCICICIFVYLYLYLYTFAFVCLYLYW